MQHAYSIVITRPSFPDPLWVIPGADGNFQISEWERVIESRSEALALFHAACDDWDRQNRHFIMTVIGTDGTFHSHSMAPKPLTLDKPAHPNLFTNV